MRCKNCGWENEPGVPKCSKCNARLDGSMADAAKNHGFQGEEMSHKRSDSTANNMRKTLNENAAFNKKASEEPAGHPNAASVVCPHCLYQVSGNMTHCPVCGNAINKKDTRTSSNKQAVCSSCGNDIVPGARFCPSCGAPLRSGTVNPHVSPAPGSYFTMRAIAWENERVQYQPVSFCGDHVILNRANTDPNNNTITSKEQALISHENGTWYLEDKSEMQTTLIHVSGKVTLHDGDIIVLGNRSFEFNG